MYLYNIWFWPNRSWKDTLYIGFRPIDVVFCKITTTTIIIIDQKINQSYIITVIQEVIFLIIIVIQYMLSNESCIISNIES